MTQVVPGAGLEPNPGASPGAEVPEPARELIYLNRDFRILWLARTFGQTASNTAQFGSLIAITELTRSGLEVSLLVLFWVLPSAILGVVVGSIIDAVSKRWMLFTANGLRAAVCFGFVLSGQGVGEIYILAAVLAMLAPFVGPAESALVPTLVGKEELTSANAFLNLMRYVAQIAGLAILAPLLAELAGIDALFVVTAVLFSAAAIYASVIPGGTGRHAPRFPDEAARWGKGAFLQALDFLKQDRIVFRAAVQPTLLAATIPLLAALMPFYLSDVLDQQVSDLPIILLPGVVGVLVGLRVVSWFANRRAAAWLGAAGLAGFTASLLLLAFIDGADATFGSIFGFRDQGLGPLPDVSAKSQLVMVIAFPMGFALSVVNVAATVVLNERAPLRMQGRIFSVQSLMASLASVFLLVVGGALAEVVDVRVVLGLTPLLLLYAWAYAQWGRVDPLNLTRRLRRARSTS